MAPLHILIVEDDQDDILLVQQELEAGGLSCTTQVVDHQAAFQQALDELEPDVVVAEFCLPRFDALSVLEQDPGRFRERPFIIFTESLDAQTEAQCLQLGATACVRKHQPERLVACVRKLLERPRPEAPREPAPPAEDRRLRAFVELVPQMVWQSDGRGHLRFFNHAWKEFAGSMADNGWLALVHPEDRERCQRLADTKALVEPCRFEARLRRCDGEYRHLSFLTSPCPTGTAGGAGFLGCAQDQAGRHPSAPPDLRHDLNNHLALVRMTAEFLAGAPGMPEAYATKAQEIAEHADAAVQLVRRLPGG